MARGDLSCLCGAIRITVSGDLGPATACHCTQCRRTSGHFSASFDVAPARMTVTGTPALHRLPSGAARAFCPVCASKLWFDAADGTRALEAGLVDPPSGAHLSDHLHLDTQGDYYRLSPDTPLPVHHDRGHCTGACLCGGVAFTVTGPLRPVIFCHCTFCRRMSGHFWAATSAPLTAITLTADAMLAWYDSSAQARRGFCRSCGAFLFYEPAGQDRYAIAAGAIDAPTGLSATRHIFTASKGDYYSIDDALPEHEGWS